MQSVLSLDLTSDPAQLQVVQVSGKTVKVLEHHTLPLSSLEAAETLAPTDIPPAEGGQAAHSDGAATSLDLKRLIEGLTSPWTNAIVIAPTPNYLSLNLELPFSDAKQIQKILPLEVQDRVPFDVDELLLEHQVLGTLNGSGNNDIHVGMVPRKSIRDVLTLCRKSELEPLYVSTPMSAVAAVHYLAPDYFAPDCAIVFVRGNQLFVTLCIDRSPRADRVITAGDFKRLSATTPSDAVVTDLKLTLTSFENRYHCKLQKVYLFGDETPSEEFKRALGRDVESLPLGELIQNGGGEPSLASLAAVFALDESPPPLLSNFRVQEFSYSPRLREVFLGLKKVLPYFLAALCAGFVALAGIYGARQYRLSGLRSETAKAIVAAFPNAVNSRGAELDALRREMNSLEEQLKSLGSLSKFSPLDVLIELTRDFPRDAGIIVRSAEIKNNRIVLEGTATDYAAVDRVEKALNNKKDIYRRVKPDVQTSFSGGPGGRPFRIEIWIAE